MALLVEIGAVLSLGGALFLDRSGHPADDTVPASRRAPIAGAVLVATIGLGFFWSATADDATPTASADGTSVTIADFAFAPPELTVPAGTTVTWTNRDDFAHSVVGGDGSFESDDIDGGASYSFTFNQAGSYQYVCGIHPSMTGTVTVS